MIRRPPRSPRVPYTTLFRSADVHQHDVGRQLVDETDRFTSVGGGADHRHAGLRVHDDRHAGAEQLLRSEEHTSELQSRQYIVCRLLLAKKHLYTNVYDLNFL